MRQMISFVILLAFAVSCEKTNDAQGTNLADLRIVSVSTPGTQLHGQHIVSNVRCTGPNLCYKFAKFDVKETATREFEVRAKATYPQGSPVCAQMIYEVDTTLQISAPVNGRYILRFYNQNSLFRSDTVQVN